jgi:hypothetical protein
MIGARLFSVDALVMGMVVSIIGWGCIEIVSNNEVIASLVEKHTVIDKSLLTISKTSETLLRMEVSQEYFNASIKKDIVEIKKSLSLLNKRVQLNPNREYNEN